MFQFFSRTLYCSSAQNMSNLNSFCGANKECKEVNKPASPPAPCPSALKMVKKHSLERSPWPFPALWRYSLWYVFTSLLDIIVDYSVSKATLTPLHLALQFTWAQRWVSVGWFCSRLDIDLRNIHLKLHVGIFEHFCFYFPMTCQSDFETNPWITSLLGLDLILWANFCTELISQEWSINKISSNFSLWFIMIHYDPFWFIKYFIHLKHSILVPDMFSSSLFLLSGHWLNLFGYM